MSDVPPDDDGGPLRGTRVVALEQAVAAPLCTRHLADLGADVVKVERPGGGDFARRYDSVVHGESAYFVWLNYGKRSIQLDVRSQAGRRALDTLLGTADVFVHNLGPGAVDRLGYGWEAVHDRWPRLIACAISGYGQDGPYRDHKAFDLLLQGESGLLSVTGSAHEPAKVGISIADIGAGMYALASILAALHERDRTGAGACLDVSMLDAMAEWMAVPALYGRYAAAQPARGGLHHATIAPYGPYLTSDGLQTIVAVQTDEQWARFCGTVLERPDLATDRRFSSNAERVANRAALDAIIGDVLDGLDRPGFEARLTAADVPVGRMNTVADLLGHPQLAARDRWSEVMTPSGPAITPRSPLGRGPAGRVPGTGEDGADILRELGLRGDP